MPSSRDLDLGLRTGTVTTGGTENAALPGLLSGAFFIASGDRSVQFQFMLPKLTRQLTAWKTVFLFLLPLTYTNACPCSTNPGSLA